MGSKTGALKVAARRLGMDFAEYQRRLEQGWKWCYVCQAWHPHTRFLLDRSRGDLLKAACQEATNRENRRRHRPRRTMATTPAPDAPTCLSCVECGSRLWDFEGELYCPDCLSFAPEKTVSQTPRADPSTLPHATHCTRCGQDGMTQTTPLWAFDVHDQRGQVGRLWLCAGCLHTLGQRLMAMMPPGQLQAWLAEFLAE